MVSSRRLSRNHDKPRNATNFDENRVSQSLQGHFSLVSEHLNDKKRVTLYNLINGNRSNNVKACNFHAIEEKVISKDLIGARKRNLSGTFPDLSYFRSDRTKYQTV